MIKRIGRRLKRLQRRYEEFSGTFPPLEFRVASALRESLATGYRFSDLRADILAGITVGMVALPLSMALAIAIGVPPQYGLYTTIVGGIVVALLGGSRVQVSGPTAAFVVILAPIVAHYGLAGLLIATVMAGVILVVLGVSRLGRMIQYVPDPVTSGFTMGIAVVIATLQLRDLLGLQIGALPQHYWDKLAALGQGLSTFRWPELALGLFSLALLIGWPYISRRIPAPLAALGLASLAGILLERLLPGYTVSTIGTTFSYLAAGVSHAGIPSVAPQLALPWQLPGPGGLPLELSYDTLSRLVPPAFAIAMLGAIESLLSAVVADGMAGTQHDPDAELIAQGAGNLLAPLFGGFACTGALARTATNIRAGARSPLAAVVHSLFVLAAVLLAAPMLSYLPMASFAALLLLVAWNMSDARHFFHILRVAPKSDVTVLLACFGLTVMFDMVVAVTGGIMLAALLFIRRMSEVSGGTVIEAGHPSLRSPLPPGVALYEITGPLFFGAANKAMQSLGAIHADARVLIIDLTRVPAVDSTGIINLESALDQLRHRHVTVILAGLQEQPARILEKAGILASEGELYFASARLDAKQLARRLLKLPEDQAAEPYGP